MSSKLIEAQYKFHLADFLEKYTDNFASSSRQLTFDSGRGFYRVTLKQDSTLENQWISADYHDHEMFERSAGHKQLGEFVRTYDPKTQYVLWFEVEALGMSGAWCMPHRDKKKQNKKKKHKGFG